MPPTERVAKFDPNPPPPLRKPKLPLKSLLLSITLFVNGIVFLLIGLSVFWRTTLYQSLPFTILGSICFVPGAYHIFIFFKVWRGNDDAYKYNMLEAYD